MSQLVQLVENSKDLCTTLDRTFGIIDEDHNITLERIYRTISIIKNLASTLSDEFVQDEEEAEAFTQSIRLEDSLLALTPSPDAPEVYEISDISSPHMDEIEEYI